jgi:hypothetical protein
MEFDLEKIYARLMNNEKDIFIDITNTTLHDMLIKTFPQNWFSYFIKEPKDKFIDKLNQVYKRFEDLPENFIIRGFEIGKEYTAKCQYWVGVKVILVGFKSRYNGLNLDIKYNGITYWFHPDWLYT